MAIRRIFLSHLCVFKSLRRNGALPYISYGLLLQSSHATAINKINLAPLQYCIKCLHTTQSYRADQVHKSNEKYGTLVFYGDNTSKIYGLKSVTLLTSFGGLMFQIFLLTQVANSILISAFLGLWVFGSPTICHFLTKIYVTKLFYNEQTKEFTAILVTLFLREKRVTFTADDVKVPAIPRLFTTCIVKGTPLFIEDKFTTSDYYIKMMSYDKPINESLRYARRNETNAGDKE